MGGGFLGAWGVERGILVGCRLAWGLVWCRGKGKEKRKGDGDE